MESLRVLPLSGAAPPTAVVSDAGRWRISGDGQRIYYLQGLAAGMPGNEEDRAGALMAADFPSGAHGTLLAEDVAQYAALGSLDGVDAGVVFVKDASGGAGVLRRLADPLHPETAVTVQSGVEYFEISRDLRYAFVEEPHTADGTPQGLVARLDGGGACTISLMPGYPEYHPVYLARPRLIFWGEEEPTGSYDMQGWYADPEGCQPKRLFTERLSYVRAVSDGILYGTYGDNQHRDVMTLRHAVPTGAGFPDDGGRLVADAVDLRMAFPAERYVVFTVSSGEGPGLYVYGPLP
jgi:hypothetical protein